MTDNLTFVLEHSGFRIVNVGSKQALAEIGRSSPDLVLMRENSHKLNGDELCIRIRELSNVPIIILGQEQKETGGVQFLEMGADAYLTSPLNVRELLARVRSLLRRTQAIAAEFRGGQLKNNDCCSLELKPVDRLNA
jgi:DNA-binding response OmpR family regulator